ncbi:MAG: hypothetical protein IPL71_20235 [Anaerolineales bacterium]|uniref:hypothetical protein n=1 Tax=Candidatus Villigracilis proximus TaxID=3140683 RepID=UPI003136DB1D|nr:hypothetical protein [Anaerolineales bacterium]
MGDQSARPLIGAYSALEDPGGPAAGFVRWEYARAQSFQSGASWRTDCRLCRTTGIEAVTVGSQQAHQVERRCVRRILRLPAAWSMWHLVVGVEKFTDKIGSEVEEAISTITDPDFEAARCMDYYRASRALMKRYMHENNVPGHGLAGFALYCSRKLVLPIKTPCSEKPLNPKTHSKADMVSDPLNMFDVAQYGCAAAPVLTRRSLLPSDFQQPLVKIAGSASSTDTLALHDRKDMLYFDTAQISAGKAMKQAGVVLNQIDF